MVAEQGFVTCGKPWRFRQLLVPRGDGLADMSAFSHCPVLTGRLIGGALRRRLPAMHGLQRWTKTMAIPAAVASLVTFDCYTTVEN